MPEPRSTPLLPEGQAPRGKRDNGAAAARTRLSQQSPSAQASWSEVLVDPKHPAKISKAHAWAFMRAQIETRGAMAPALAAAACALEGRQSLRDEGALLLRSFRDGDHDAFLRAVRNSPTPCELSDAALLLRDASNTIAPLHARGPQDNPIPTYPTDADRAARERKNALLRCADILDAHSRFPSAPSIRAWAARSVFSERVLEESPDATKLAFPHSPDEALAGILRTILEADPLAKPFEGLSEAQSARALLACAAWMPPKFFGLVAKTLNSDSPLPIQALRQGFCLCSAIQSRLEHSQSADNKSPFDIFITRAALASNAKNAAFLAQATSRLLSDRPESDILAGLFGADWITAPGEPSLSFLRLLEKDCPYEHFLLVLGAAQSHQGKLPVGHIFERAWLSWAACSAELPHPMAPLRHLAERFPSSPFEASALAALPPILLAEAETIILGTSALAADRSVHSRAPRL